MNFANCMCITDVDYGYLVTIQISQFIIILATSLIYFKNAEYTDFSMVKLLEPSALNFGLKQLINFLTVRTSNVLGKKRYFITGNPFTI